MKQVAPFGNNKNIKISQNQGGLMNLPVLTPLNLLRSDFS